MSAWKQTKGVLAVIADVLGIFAAIFFVFNFLPAQSIEVKLIISLIIVVIAVVGLLLFFWWKGEKKGEHGTNNLPAIIGSVGELERTKKIVSTIIDAGARSSGPKDFTLYARKGAKLRLLISSDFPIDAYLLDKWHHDRDDYDGAIFIQEDAYEINKDVRLMKDGPYFLIIESRKLSTITKVDVLVIDQ